MAGADLIGTTLLENKTVFLIGEVKTSSSPKSPPGITYKLATELKELSDVEGSRVTSAVRWLMLHKNNFDESAINEAYENYQYRKITGMLVRDTSPNKKDMEKKYLKLLSSLSEDIFLLMVALYMPIKIDDFKKYMVA